MYSVGCSVRSRTPFLWCVSTPEAVEAGANDLRVGGLGEDGGDGLLVPAEDVDVAARAHVPYADHAVAAAGAQHVERRVQGQGVHAGQVAVVVADHFVRLQIPALDHLVLAAGEEVGVARGDGEPAHGGDVAGEFEDPRRQVPDFDGAVPCA